MAVILVRVPSKVDFNWVAAILGFYFYAIEFDEGKVISCCHLCLCNGETVNNFLHWVWT